MPMPILPSDTRLHDLAAFLRTHRERLLPQELGLTVSARRRAPGLLREEVAQVAGMSATWYTWMEQARPINPSLRVLAGLARALRLDPAGRAHLFELARPDLRPAAISAPTRVLGEPLLAALAGLAPHPAYVTNARFDVLAWNEPAARLLGDFGAIEPERRNLIHLLFIAPDWRTLFVDWHDVARLTVAQLRVSSVRLAADAEFRKFIERTAHASADFADLWASQEIRRAVAWKKRLNHPTAGRMAFNFASFHPDSADEDLRFTIYTPADASSADRFAALLAPAPPPARGRRRRGADRIGHDRRE